MNDAKTGMVVWIGLALLLSPVASGAAKSTVVEGPRPLAIELGAPFHDHAVLQRGMRVPVWGWSKPGTSVTVSFAGQEKGATAGTDGKWMLELEALRASFEPAEMRIREVGGKTETLHNILVGEVWMASGQSNMQWKVTKSTCAKIAKELAAETAGKPAPIREFEVSSVYAMLHPIEHATGSWKDGNYTDYSAIAFAFAHTLYKELGVPVGILNCSFSQTPIQAWVPREGFRDGNDDHTKAIYQKILQTDPTTPEHEIAWAAFYSDLEAQIAANDARIQRGDAPLAITASPPGNFKGNRDASWLFHGRLNPVVPYAIRGGIWNQGWANIGDGLRYYNNLHSMIRGWRQVWNRPELPVYFHQFYSHQMGKVGQEDNSPALAGAGEMRLGTWMARDIPHTGMASQIDITGGIHYTAKAVPGRRLALHALKNQYEKELVADGPMYKSYTVEGDKLIIDFEHADDGLVVAESYSNTKDKENGTGFADPRIIDDGESHVALFYLADENRIWYPASVTLDGSKAIVTSPKVKNPRGVSYGTAGVGFQPNLYNKALLPMTPFIVYDKAILTSETWPGEALQVDGVEVDPNAVGKLNEYRRMPLLSTQFRDNAVLQAGKPVTIWGSVRNYGEWQPGPESGKCVVHFEFGDIKRTIEVTPEMSEWQVTLPPRQATAQAHTLKVSFTVDGELAHQRELHNIVFGDVYYVAANGTFKAPDFTPSGQIVRVMRNHSKRSTNKKPSRFSVCVSRTPNSQSQPNANRFAARWLDAEGVAAVMGHRLAAKSGNPVGIIFMQSKKNPELKSWIAPEFLKQAPSLMADYEVVGAQYPGNPYYNAAIRRYIGAWKAYWGEFIPEMIASKAVPDGKPWGSYPAIASGGESTATETYNVMVDSFAPTALKGVLFLSGEGMVAADQGANFGPEFSALANSFKAKFGDVPFIYSRPSKALAPKISHANGIRGTRTAVEISDWSEIGAVIDAAVN
jgi:hypothetical protein